MYTATHRLHISQLRKHTFFFCYFKRKNIISTLSPNAVQILDGAVTLTKRKASKAWQCRYRIGRKWIRLSTHQNDLDKAKKVAHDSYLRAKYREDEGLPIVNKRFDAVARVAKQKLLNALNANEGKVIYKDYITAIDRYLIPFFGNYNVNSITYGLIKEFAEWRDKRLGRKTKASTINTHNSALNRIFEEGLTYGYMVKSQIPLLQNKGVKSQRRPNFTLEEYLQLARFMRHWIKTGKEGKSTDMRYLLRDYVLILANTGMRHGTEAYGIKWKHLSWHTNEGARVLMISVDGKTGQRELVARHSAVRYFKRIHSRAIDLKHLSFEEVIKQGLDEYVFRLADGTKTENLGHTFTALLKDADLLIDRRTDTNRTLYSLRHTYASFALLYNKIPIFDLEMQMGTSVEMIRKHYSHLTTRSVARQLAGGLQRKEQLRLT